MELSIILPELFWASKKCLLPPTHCLIQPSREFLFPGNSQHMLTEVPDFLSSVLIGRKKMELLNGGVTMIRSDNKKCCSKTILTIIIIVAHIHYVRFLCQDSC